MTDYPVDPAKFAKPVIALIVLIIIAALGSKLIKTIDAGHVGVATLFGKVQQDTYKEGLHIVNPLYKWTIYDVRQKSHKETAGVPTQDQLTTTVEISIQFRIDSSMAAQILQTTGTADQVITVHMVPKIRSLLREQGKSIKRAEDFFLEETQQRFQVSLTNALKENLGPKGINVEKVLVRDIRLPTFITKAIESKKEREQEVEKQKAELERFRTEQQQLLAQAEAEREAAEQEALKIQLLADAQAYEIEQINKAIADNPAYIQLQALDALKAISSDKASKIYFINGESPMPLPLMHMGENVGK